MDLACLIIDWNFDHMNSTIAYDHKTINFQLLLYNWRNCITNTSAIGNTTLCQRCQEQFNNVFDFYWKIYTDPVVDFCLDIETTVSYLVVIVFTFFY